MLGEPASVVWGKATSPRNLPNVRRATGERASSFVAITRGLTVPTNGKTGRLNQPPNAGLGPPNGVPLFCRTLDICAALATRLRAKASRQTANRFLSGQALPANAYVARAEQARVLLRAVAGTVALHTCSVLTGINGESRTLHQEVRISRVDVLNKEYSREGNAVLVWPEAIPLRIEPLVVGGI